VPPSQYQEPSSLQEPLRIPEVVEEEELATVLTVVVVAELGELEEAFSESPLVGAD
jgi:hypothetical protein